MARKLSALVTVCLLLLALAGNSISVHAAFAASVDQGVGSLLGWSPETIPLYRLKLAEVVSVGATSAPMVWYAYTSVESEREALKDIGWTDDAIVTYVSQVPVVGVTASLLRWVHADGRQYYLTTDSTHDLSSYGWVRSGNCGFVRSVIAGQELGFGEEFVYLHTPFISEPGYMSTAYFSNDASWAEAPSGVSYLPGAAQTAFCGWRAQQEVQNLTIEPVSAVLTGGDKVKLYWSSTYPGGLIELLFSKDDGASWASVAKNLPNGPQEFEWTIPNVTSDTCRLMIRWSLGQDFIALVWATGQAFAITASASPAFTATLPGAVPAESLARSASPLRLYALADQTKRAVALGWVPNVGEATGFLIERASSLGAFSQIGTAPQGATTFTDTTALAGQSYWYRVKATTSGGLFHQSAVAQGAYYVSGGQTPEPPIVMAPSDLQATRPAGTIRTAQLNWTHSTEARLHHYLVERRTTGEWQPVAAVMPTTNSYRDASLSDSLASGASYRVRAVTLLGRSAVSNEVALSYAGDPVRPDFDGTQSGWAEPELVLAFQNGLTYPGVMFNFGNKITREEFCTIVVKLYEKLTGTIALPGVDPFVDTDNPDILKAYALGIVRGVSATQFAPANNITRQEMCVMIYRALQAAGENTLLTPGGNFPFVDQGQIASWALNEVRFCYQNQIMRGTSETTISPLMNTPREQAIVLIYRTHQAFK